MDGSGLDGFFFLLGGLVFALPIGLVVLGILVFASNRDVDATGRRSYAAYLCTVCFVSLFAALFAAFATSSSLLGLARSDDDDSALAPARPAAVRAEFHGGDEGPVQGDMYGPEDMGPDSGYDDDFGVGRSVEADEGDAAARGAVGGGIALLVSAGAFVYHYRRLRDLRTGADYAKSPAARVEHAYAYATAFVAILVALGSGGAALWGAFKVAAPGVAAAFGEAERIDGLVDLLEAALLAAGSTAILVVHLRRGRELRDAMQPAGANGDTPTQIQI